MKKILLSVILGLSLALGSCSARDLVVHDPATLVTPVQKIQAGIDQAKLTVVAVIRGAVADREAGVYTDDEWYVLKEQINEVTRHIDSAQDALNLGDEVMSGGQLKLAESAIDYLKAELIKRKNEGK